MHTDEILLSLDDVKPNGKGQWTSRCPNQDHRSARVSIMDTGEKTLIRCWGGCSTGDVISAIGLTFSDLYHHDMTVEKRQERKQIHTYEQLCFERTLLQLAHNSRSSLSDEDKKRANQAHRRLRDAGWLTMTDKLIEQDKRQLCWH